MFRGCFEHSIDEKGRTSLPARFREVLSALGENNIIITNDAYCLVAYAAKDWQKKEEAYKKLPQDKIEVKRFLRVLCSGASDCPVDKQGRILIPPMLRKVAGLEKDIVIIGMIDRIEIWDKEKWELEIRKAREEFEVNSLEISKYAV